MWTTSLLLLQSKADGKGPARNLFYKRVFNFGFQTCFKHQAFFFGVGPAIIPLLLRAEVQIPSRPYVRAVCLFDICTL